MLPEKQAANPWLLQLHIWNSHRPPGCVGNFWKASLSLVATSTNSLLLQRPRQAFAIFTRRSTAAHSVKRPARPLRTAGSVHTARRRQTAQHLPGSSRVRDGFSVGVGPTDKQRRCSVWRLNIGSSLGWLSSWVTSALHVSARGRPLVSSCILKPVATTETVGALPLPFRWSGASAHAVLLCRGKGSKSAGQDYKALMATWHQRSCLSRWPVRLSIDTVTMLHFSCCLMRIPPQDVRTMADRLTFLPLALSCLRSLLDTYPGCDSVLASARRWLLHREIRNHSIPRPMCTPRWSLIHRRGRL